MDHLGIQVDDDSELKQITERLKDAHRGVYNEGETTRIDLRELGGLGCVLRLTQEVDRERHSSLL